MQKYVCSGHAGPGGVPPSAVSAAIRLVKEGGADMVKITNTARHALEAFTALIDDVRSGRQIKG